MLYAESLVANDSNSRTTPALAEWWDWSGERRRLNIRLKEGVLFHDGTPLTSDAVVGFLRQHLGQGLLGFKYITGVTAADPRTIVIQLSRPDAFLLPELSDLRVTHPQNPNIGTGPFELVTRDGLVQTRRFDRYHGGRPSLAGVTIAAYESHRSAWAALMKGEVDVVQEVTREAVDFMKGSTKFKPLSAIQPFYVPLILNHRHTALGNVEVRRAMLEAVDRHAIIQRAMNGFGRIADMPLWPQHWAYVAPTERPQFNPEVARARLDRAGFRLRRSTSKAPQSRFSFRCLVWSEDPQYERIALMLQRHLFDVGIDMEIDMATLDTIGRRAGTGDFDALLARTNSSRTLNMAYQFWRSKTGDDLPIFNIGYTGTNDAFDGFRSSVSDDETRAAVAELIHRFQSDVPAVFIAWTEIARAVDTRFAVGDDRAPDPFANIWQWRPVTN